MKDSVHFSTLLVQLTKKNGRINSFLTLLPRKGQIEFRNCCKVFDEKIESIASKSNSTPSKIVDILIDELDEFFYPLSQVAFEESMKLFFSENQGKLLKMLILSTFLNKAQFEIENNQAPSYSDIPGYLIRINAALDIAVVPASKVQEPKKEGEEPTLTLPETLEIISLSKYSNKEISPTNYFEAAKMKYLDNIPSFFCPFYFQRIEKSRVEEINEKNGKEEAWN